MVTEIGVGNNNGIGVFDSVESDSEPRVLRAAVYVRVSSLEQAENWSLEGQIRDIKKYCKKKGYKVVRIYKDPGFSGKDIERPGLQAILEYAIRGAFDVLVVWKYDRLSRNEVDFPVLLNYFKNLNIQIESVNEPVGMENTPYNEFIVGIFGLVSALYRKELIGRTRMGMRVRLQNGFFRGTCPPYGYNYNTKTGHLEFNKIEYKAVVDIFHKYLEWESLGAVRRWLEKNRIPTKRGARWKINTIRGILENKVYLGYYIYKDIVTYHEEIRLISEETFLKVRKKLKERAKLGPAGFYNPRILKFRGQLFWENDTDNEIVQEHLARKAEMPQCPRCGDNIAVRKWGFKNSPTFGRLQTYNCKPCNHEFIIYPEKPIRIDVDVCPKCKSKRFVRKEGGYWPKSGGKVQKYYCNKCRYWFRASLPLKLDNIRPKCPYCGAEKVYSQGKRRFGNNMYQYWQCQECGKYWGIEC